MKSPIKDTRFLNKSISYFKKIIPKDSTVNTFGIFSGIPEISLSSSGITVNAFTSKTVIYQFWYCLFENKQRLYNILTDDSFRFNGDRDYKLLQRTLPSCEDAYMRSSLFFMLNRCSQSGQISCGEFDPDGYTSLALRNLMMFRKPELFNIFFYKENHKAMKDADYLLFHSLNFSYNLTNLGSINSYDGYNFNSRKLRTLMESESDKKIIMSYRYHPALAKFYKDYQLKMINKYGNQTSITDECVEVVVANF